MKVKISNVAYFSTNPIQEVDEKIIDSLDEKCYRIKDSNIVIACKYCEVIPEPKFKVGDVVIVIDNISNSIIGMKGTIKIREFNHDTYPRHNTWSYLIDFKKIQHWRDLTWVKEFEIKTCYETPLVILSPSGTNYWFKKFKNDVIDAMRVPKELLNEGEDKMEILKELERQHKEIGELITKMKEQEKSKDDYVLKLRVHCGILEIYYTIEETVRYLGCIDFEGDCHILNSKRMIENYELWREKGMKVCSDKVEWKGKYYYIDEDFTLRSLVNTSCIYDFGDCEYFRDCQDDNIVRFKHNNKPIGF